MPAEELTSEEKARELLRKNILICGAGSIGAASLPFIVSQIRAIVPEASLRVVLTENAARMVSAEALSFITQHVVRWEWSAADQVAVPPHVELASWADAVLVMPATGNVIGKAAAGIADDLVTSCLLAFSEPTVFVPSMNQSMWKNPIVQRNVRMLREFGRHVMDPFPGMETSSGKVNIGGMPPLRDVLHELVRAFAD